MNLMDLVGDVVKGNVLDSVAGMIGQDKSTTSSAISKLAPAIIGGLINKGGTTSGAQGLIDMFTKQGLGDSNLSNLAGILGNADKKESFLKGGTGMLESLFGSNLPGILGKLTNIGGLSKGSSSMLMKFLAPVIMNKLAGMVSSKKMNASGLSSYLLGQKSAVNKVSGLSSLLGFADKTTSTTTSRVEKRSTVTTGGSNNNNNKGGGLGLLKWLLPLLALGALAWFLSQGGCGDKKVETKKVETTKVESHDGHNHGTTTTTTVVADDHSGAHAPGHSADDGHRHDAPGHAATTTTTTVEKIEGKTGEVVSNGTKATTKTVEEMKTIFINMFEKKAGAKTNYTLNDIQFDKEGHKITSFTKSEVVGLANALKSNAKGKIEVQVYTNDGKDGKENSKLSKTRAELVTQMLETLGVNKKQISFKGMGSSDAAKAASDRVEIQVK